MTHFENICILLCAGFSQTVLHQMCILMLYYESYPIFMRKNSSNILRYAEFDVFSEILLIDWISCGNLETM